MLNLNTPVIDQFLLRSYFILSHLLSFHLIVLLDLLHKLPFDLFVSLACLLGFQVFLPSLIVLHLLDLYQPLAGVIVICLYLFLRDLYFLPFCQSLMLLATFL